MTTQAAPIRLIRRRKVPIGQIGDGGTTNSVGTGSVTNDAVVTFNRSNDVTVANAISGSVEKLGAGMLTHTANNTYQGATTISAGRLALSHASSNFGWAIWPPTTAIGSPSKAIC